MNSAYISRRYFSNSHLSVLFSAVMLGISLATPVDAATISVFPQLVAAYKPDGSPSPLPASSLGLPSESRVFEVGLFLSVSDLAGGEQGFGNVLFEIHLSGSAKLAVAPFPAAYSPHSKSIDHDNSAFTPPVAIFADNADFGDPLDLTSIIVGVDPTAFAANDPRLAVGIGTPEWIGSVFVAFSPELGAWAGKISVVVGDASVVAGGLLEQSLNLHLVNGSLDLVAVPEPAAGTLLLGGLIAILPVIRRRRRKIHVVACRHDVVASAFE